MTDHSPQKPKLRGVLHQAAALVTLGAGLVLVATAPSTRAAWGAAVFAGSLVTLFTVSAIYHRVNWSPGPRAWMRRADHASIFVLIAGTYTPCALLGLPPEDGTDLLWLVWGGAIIGILVSLFWVNAPKAVTAVLCVAVGWSGVPFWARTEGTFEVKELALLTVGGVLYTAGAVVYALKRPHLWRDTFGYHELFHACTIAAALLHFLAVFSLVQRG